MLLQFQRGIELQPRDDAEAVAQGVGEHAGAGGGADERERRQIELDRTRRRALADHDVELEILQRRIQDFLHHRRQAVDLVDEQHVVRFEVGEQRGEIARALQHRARGMAQVDPHLARDDVRQGRFSQTRRAEQQHVIERLFALARRLDEYPKLVADFLLADVLGQSLGPQRTLERLFLRRGGIGGDQAVDFNGHALFYPRTRPAFLR